MAAQSTAELCDTETLTELELFEQFVTGKLLKGQRSTPLDEAVAEFRAYREEVERLHAELAIGIEQLKRGEGRPLDVDAMKARIRARLAAKGIVDE